MRWRIHQILGMHSPLHLGDGLQGALSLLQDAANATLRSETLRWNCVRCNNHKRWCMKTIKKGACAMKGIWFNPINCLWWGGTKEMGSQMKVCAIYNIRFTRMNCLWLGNTKETVRQIKVCVIYDMRFTRMNYLRWDKRTETVQYNKMCVLRGKQVCNQKCVRRSIITQTVASNKLYVLWANDWWYTFVSDWLNHHRRVPQEGPCAMSLHTEQQHMYLYLIRTWFHKQIEHRITYVASTHMTFAHTKVCSKMPRKLK